MTKNFRFENKGLISATVIQRPRAAFNAPFFYGQVLPGRKAFFDKTKAKCQQFDRGGKLAARPFFQHRSGDKGLISTDRGTKTTLMRTIPRHF